MGPRLEKAATGCPAAASSLTTPKSYFLLNREDISTLSFLPSLKVLLRRRN